jgi:hypothetical protein
MRTSTRCSRATHPVRSRQVGVAVALVACVGLAACTAAEPPSSASTAKAATVAPLPDNGDLDAGTYRVTGYPVPFEITVPDGWSSTDGAALQKSEPNVPDGSAVFLLFWPATHVATDACVWRGALVPVGPTAEAFVDAMTAQTSAVSSPPVEVVVGDYSGFEFDHSVEDDVDVPSCDSGIFCIHAESSNQCSRWYSTEHERETYRVVDLNGQRAVIALSQYIDPALTEEARAEPIDPALMEEARAVFDSIEFIRPDE